MARLFKRIGIGLLILVLALAGMVLWGMGPGNFGRMVLGLGISYDSQRPVLPNLNRPAILIFSKTNGYRHAGTIAAGNAALEKLARKRGWSSYTTENAAVFNPEQLVRFTVVVWNNTSGDVLTAPQRAAFKSWLENGGGFVGIHAAGGDSSYRWGWYVERLIGAQFIGHTLNPHIEQGRLVVENATHPAMRGLGKEWIRSDEWYSFDKSPRSKGYQVLMVLDEASYTPEIKFPLFPVKDLRMGQDHPMVWTHCPVRGRAFYSALGHEPSAWTEPKYLAMIAGAINWAAGQDGSSCSPAA